MTQERRETIPEVKATMSKREDDRQRMDDTSKPTNEYVLNVAFTPFVGFECQAVFALIANSEAMLADSEVMSVDAFTYLFNLWAERIKKEPHWKWLICGPPELSL
jgi:Co/Zn/Cd efflux system component